MSEDSLNYWHIDPCIASFGCEWRERKEKRKRTIQLCSKDSLCEIKYVTSGDVNEIVRTPLRTRLPDDMLQFLDVMVYRCSQTRST